MKTKIDCDKALIKEIFANWYSIPSYQRPYVWETDQVEELLDCIKNAYEANEEQYFLGSIVYKKSEKEVDGLTYEELELLDGQQRITTIFLIIASIRDIVIENNIILNAGTHGIGVTPLVGSIERNLVRNCTKNGIYLYGYSFVSCQGNICSNNAIDIYGTNGQIGKQTYSKLCNNIAYVRTDGQQSNTVTIDNNL